MGAPTIPDTSQKRKHSKKKKKRSRLEVSSDSESEIELKRSRKRHSEEAIENVTLDGVVKKSKKDKKNKPADTSSKAPEAGADITMADHSASPAAESTTEDVAPKDMLQEEDFTSIYLRKITTELADDLDKVREANDFTNRSLSILIHALKQGESMFSTEERRRVVSAAANIS